MPFEILIEAASVVDVDPGPPPFNRYPQAEPDKVDFDILVQGINGEGVVSGGVVTPQGVPDTTVAVAACVVRIAGTDVAFAGGNVNCGAANPALPRFDLIAINNAGVASAVAGVAGRPTLFAAVPANSVIVASVWRAANDNTITANDLVDKRCLLLGVKPRQYFFAPAIPPGVDVPVGPQITIHTTPNFAEDIVRITVQSGAAAGGNFVFDIEQGNGEDQDAGGFAWVLLKTVTVPGGQLTFVDAAPAVATTARRPLRLNITAAPAGWQDMNMTVEAL